MSESVIHWSDEARARVSILDAAKLSEDKPRAATYYWSSLRQKYGARERYIEGLETAEADVAEWTRAADVLLMSSDLPPEDTPLEVASLLWHMTPVGVATARLMIDRFGLVRAVESWATAASYVVRRPSYQAQNQKGFTVVLRDDEPTAITQETHFRTAILRATPEEYALARAAVAPLFETGGLQAKAAIVSRFPNDAPWVKALSDAYVEDTTNRFNWLMPPVLLTARISLEDAVRVARRAGPSHSHFETLLDLYGAEALPLVYEVAAAASQASHFEYLARVLACVDTEEAANFLAENIGKKAVRKRAVDYFLRLPKRAKALARYEGKKTRVARMALDLVEQSARASRELNVPEADPSTLPAILVAPPWAGGERPKRKAKVIADVPVVLPHEDRLHGRDYPQGVAKQGRPMNDEEAAAWLKKVSEIDGKKQWPRKAFLYYENDGKDKLTVPAELRLKVWNDDLWPYVEHAHTALGILGEHAAAAIPGLVHWAEKHLPKVTHSYGTLPIVDSEVAALAPAIAHLLRKRDVGKTGRKWMRRFPEAAIAGLLPACVGKKGTKRREVCEQALRWLVKEGYEERIRERAKELGKSGPSAIDEVLGWDPLYDCPKKPPKLPTTYRPEGFVRPLTHDGTALPLSAMTHLGEMLAFSPPEETYVGLNLVKEICTERSLAEFAWSVASAWETAGGDKRQRWMYYSIIHLADDEVVRRTTPALKNPLIVDVLSYIPTEAAAMELATIAFRGANSSSIYSSAQVQAESALDRLAEARGISRDVLDDQLTPTLGLDEKGMLRLDFGSRVFQVGFDEQLMPEVVDAKGNRRKALPRGAKDDDPDKLAAAKLAWTELKEDVGAIAMFRIDALESAMLGQREWALADFREHWAAHRLMMHLARRVVWTAQRPKQSVLTFRVAEDATLADVNDDVVELDADARISVPHPLRWPDDSLARWREVFDDYELLQPFAQLSRPVPVVTQENLDSNTIERVRGGNNTLIRRSLAERGYEVSGGRNRRSLGDGSEVTVSTRYHSGGIRIRLDHLRNGENVPWSAAPEGALLMVLDELGLFAES